MPCSAEHLPPGCNPTPARVVARRRQAAAVEW
jgi:hypothetical protein